MGTSQERRPCRVSNATWTGPLSEAMPACRGRRADHAQKDRVGTWEIPRSARAIPLLVRIEKGEPKADDERTLANKAERSVAEPVEPRAGTKGNANQQHTGRTQSRETVSQVLAPIRQTARNSDLPSLTRGRSRMRESRTYGWRGAISVPTATVAGRAGAAPGPFLDSTALG